MSESTANDLVRFLGVGKHRLKVVYPVLNTRFQRSSPEEIGQLRKRHNLPDKFWLYVAHFYQHKNHLNLIRAYAHLRSCGFEPWPLVLRGDRKEAEDAIRELISELELRQDVVFLPRLELSEMPTLYSAASGLVFPSLYEGGGLPVSEAMACGCPVIASSIPAVLEYSGGKALYFPPHDVPAMANSMRKLQEDESFRRKLAQDGLSQASRFRGKTAAQEILSAYEEAVEIHKC
jgi:glycosyltransferase involved in cell wall biosynthesis